MSSIPMYTHVHHDRRNEFVFIWYADGNIDAFKTQSIFYTPNLGEYGSVPCGMRDIYGKEMYRVITPTENEIEIRKRHRGPKNYLSELDIDFRTRWLQTHYKDCSDIRFKMEDFNIGYIDIEVATADRFPTADKADRPVNCVTLYASKLDVYYVFGLGRELKSETYQKFIDNNLKVEYECCSDEVELLNSLFSCIGSSSLDFILAWNGDFYDYPYLVNRASKLGVDIRQMSRLPKQFRSAYISKHDNMLKIAGTTVLDHMKLYKKFTMKEKDSYKLDDIGYSETKQRKAPLPDGYHSYKNYWDDYVFYNIMDVKLAKDIEAKRRMLETTIAACAEARVPFESIFESKKMLVGFILNILHSKNLTFPPLKDVEGKEFPGAIVYSKPGYYEWLVSFDYRSMYPSIMMGANISPETKVEYPYSEVVPDDVLVNLVRSPWTANNTKQVFYRKDKEGIVPIVVKILFDGRTELKNMAKKAKKNGDYDTHVYYDMKQNAYKIFANSLYGLLGNPYFQLYDPDNSASVTAFGVELITMTVREFTAWMEGDFVTDSRYEQVFGVKPTLNTAYNGTTTNENGELLFNRLSHGDTDSFFVKLDDLYRPFIEKVDKEAEVLVFSKPKDSPSKLLDRQSFDVTTSDSVGFDYFTQSIDKYTDNKWGDIEEEDQGKIYHDGQYVSGDIRIIYNRFNLTDYCRVFDTAILEDKLAEIMQIYADKWNYKENTLFLKREKCISKAIVTAKKKYICFVESNEDAKYAKPEFAVTGLEIVRSSTTPFSRKYVQSMVEELLNELDKAKIKKKYFEIKKEFFKTAYTGNAYDISIPSGVKKDPPKLSDLPDIMKTERVDWRIRSASVWNHLIETDDILSTYTLEPIFERSKVKFINVHENSYGITKMAFIGNTVPPHLFEIFKPNWETQWETSFANVMGRLFEAVGWSSDFENDDRDMIKMLC